MADGDFRDAALVGRPIRTSDYVFAADPSQTDLSLAGRSDTLAQMIATIYQNPPASLTTAQQTALRALMGLTGSEIAGLLDAAIGTAWRTGGTPGQADGVVDLASFNNTSYVASLRRTVGAAVNLDLSPILTTINALTARVAALEGTQPDHSAYLGWSNDRAILVSDFASAVESDNHEWTVPTQPSGQTYLWYGVTTDDGAPDYESVAGFRQPDTAFTQTGQVQYMGTTYIIFVTAVTLSASAAGQDFQLHYS